MFSYTKVFNSWSVDDLGKAKAFYGKTLGLPVKESPEGLSITLPEGQNLFMYPKPDHQPATYTVLGFQVSDIDAAVDQLTAAGVTFLQYEGDLKTDKKGIARNLPGGGPLAAWFADPASNILGIMQDK
jgi:predicted enzyme related to lactoylglutathione lyase